MRVYNKNMPIASMPPAELVTTTERYQKMIAHLKGQTAIAIDTESNSLFAYQERVCLIQLSSKTQDFLLDPFAFDDLSALGELIADETIEKLLHAGDYDISTLKRDYGFIFNNVFDTMLAASALGETNLGLGTLLEKYFGIVLTKKFQRANWGERPLKQEMLAYAQADSHFLIKLRDYLVPRLEAIGWLDLLREDANAMAKNMPPMRAHGEDVWRVKGSRDLNASEMSLLEALNHTREMLAEKRNRPPFKIFGDTAMVTIALAMPQSLTQLSQLKVLSPHQVKRFGSVIVNTVLRWQENPGKLYRPANHRIAEDQFDRFEGLMDLRKNIGHQEGVPSNLILSREMVEKMAKVDPDNLESLKEVMSDYPLRFERYGKQILDLLERIRR